MSWPQTSLGRHIELVSGAAFKSSAFTDDSSDVPLVKGENIGQGEILWDKSKYWPRSDSEQYERFKLRAGDVILAMDRPWVTAGLKFAVINERDPEALLVQRVARLRGTERLSSRFLRYVIASPEFSAYAKNLMGGVNVPHISGDQIRAYQIALPTLSEQDRIADILSAYDDLIENNRRRIQLLEQAARLLYKEWFVHLRFPGHEHVKITNGVPEGWHFGTVADFYNTASGGTPSRKKSEYFTGDIPWVKTQELPNGFVVDTDEHITQDAVKNSSAKLFSKDTVLLALYGATIGELGILGRDATCNQACCAIMPREERSHFSHAYLFFRENKKNLVALSGGAAQNNISQQIVREFPMMMPSKTIVALFVRQVEPLFQEWQNLDRQILALTKARDLLLPRLMNGSILV